MKERQDIEAGRLDKSAYETIFCDSRTALSLTQARIESSRCLFCYDAPCVQACPTGIDIPNFIRKIHSENLTGAAVEILDENIMGGTCARVCPTEVLCEQACVRHTGETKPVEIGLLQRYATDYLFSTDYRPYKRAASTGKKIAVVGGGPAGLSCAHRLSRFGHDVVVFEAREKLGGLNEYGIAPYKVPDSFAQKEVDFILSLGGIEVRTNHRLGQQVSLESLHQEFDAVFLGVGLGAVNDLGMEEPRGVYDAVDFIATIRQAKDLSTIEVGRRVIVIGGGNTAVDIAIQMKRLGADDVTLAYRRGQQNMSATEHEQSYAKENGVRIKHYLQPTALESADGVVTGVTFEKTDGSMEVCTLPADQVFKAIGQRFSLPQLGELKTLSLKLSGKKIAVDDNRRTSSKGIYAGGDCIALGEDLTVSAVQDGKVAALAIHQDLMGENHG